tara:strand:+ start:603 stop:974 length:372 start_codon:yes stop_codon:yes gene_type:complete
MTEKNKGGRPQKEIDYTQLDKYCAIQCTGEECAALLEMDYDTLNRGLKRDGFGGFTDYFEQKSSFGKASLRRRQYKLAEEGNPTMLIWLGKQWLGQSEKKEITIADKEELTPWDNIEAGEDEA